MRRKIKFNNQASSAFVLTMVCVSIGLAAAPSKAVLIDISQRSRVPALRLPESSGQRVSVDQYRGKVVLLDFWATWCGGCKQELPWFAGFEASFKPEGFSVIAVSMDDGGWSTVTPFVSTHRMPGKVLLDDGSSAVLFDIQAMPVALLIDRHGKIAAKYVGLVERRNIQETSTSCSGNGSAWP